MSPSRPLLAPCLLAGLLLGAGPSRADVVHLTNGNTIRGEVVSEDERQVVVRTPDGRVVLRKVDVARIEREAVGRRLLEEARQAARNRDPRAGALYERCLAEAERAADAALADLARRELETWRARPAAGEEAAPEADPAAADAPAGTRRFPWAGRPDPCVETSEPEAIIRELEAAVAAGTVELRGRLGSLLYQRAVRRAQEGQHALAASDFRRCRPNVGAEHAAGLLGAEYRCRLQEADRALRARDARRAGRAVEVVAGDEAAGELRPRGQYLLGRALELLGRRNDAQAAFLACLGSRVPANRADLTTLRELARLATSGIPVDDATPGMGAGWHWVTTQHFAILHQLEAAQGQALGELAERALEHVRSGLQLGASDQVDMGPIAVFVYADEARYRASAGARAWSAGHAHRLRTEFEVIRSIYVFQQEHLEDYLRHEVAHIVVGDSTDGALLPAWANEGAAIYVEGARSQGYHRRVLRALRPRLLPPADALGQMLPPLSDEPQAVQLFYAQAAAMFAILGERVGPARALECLEHVNEEGPDRALGRAGLSLDAFEEAWARALDE